MESSKENSEEEYNWYSHIKKQRIKRVIEFEKINGPDAHQFYLLDETVDPPKILADGMEFQCGKCVMCWRGDVNSVVVHDNIENIKKIHCQTDGRRFTWSGKC